MGGGFGRSNQDDPRCNGTLRKQASPRSSTLGVGSALTAGQGKAKCYLKVAEWNSNKIFKTKASVQFDVINVFHTFNEQPRV